MLSVAEATSASDELVFSFALRNPSSAQDSPDISVSGSILGSAGVLASPFTSAAMDKSTDAALGVSGAAAALNVFVPTIATAVLGHTSPFALATNTLTLTLQFSQDMASGSTLTISGMANLEEGDTSSLAVSDDASAFATTATFVQADGTLALALAADVSATTTVVVTFDITNPASAQSAPTLSISGAVAAAGDFTSLIPSLAITMAAGDLQGVVGGAAPFFTSVPSFVSGSIMQSNPFVSESNTITVSFVTSMNLIQSHAGALTVSGLEGFTIGASPSLTDISSTDLETVLADPAGNSDADTWVAGIDGTVSQDVSYAFQFSVTNPTTAQVSAPPNLASRGFKYCRIWKGGANSRLQDFARARALAHTHTTHARTPTHTHPPYCCPYPCPYCTLPLLHLCHCETMSVRPSCSRPHRQ